MTTHSNFYIFASYTLFAEECNDSGHSGLKKQVGREKRWVRSSSPVNGFHKGNLPLLLEFCELMLWSTPEL